MYLGIDIGGTKTLVATLNDEGVIQQKQKFPTPKPYPDFLRALAQVVANITSNDVHAAGVAVPGKLDRSKGMVIACGNLPWQNLTIQHDIEKIIHKPVVIENDANLAGLSEAMLLKDKYRLVLYLTVSTGINAGVIVDQTIDVGSANAEAGQIELEYQGKMQRWEDFASGSAIVRRYGKLARDITDPNDWQDIAHAIAIGLVELVAIIQPEVIVIGGSVGRYFSRFSTALSAALKEFETPLLPIPSIIEAQRPDEAVVYGCYDLAKSLYGNVD